MTTEERAAGILAALKEEYPDAECTLEETDPWKLLVQVRLAAQCTDERVNKVTPALFERFPDCYAMAKASVEEVEEYIHSCGFYRGKARDIVLTAQRLTEVYGGVVPNTMEELLTLPGVGRKSANLILGDVYNVPGSVVVDTHCIRLTNRIGMIDGVKEPGRLETLLQPQLPPEKSSDFCHRIVLHGRAVCDARKPDCAACCVKELCQSYSEGEANV